MSFIFIFMSSCLIIEVMMERVPISCVYHVSAAVLAAAGGHAVTEVEPVRAVPRPSPLESSITFKCLYF